MKHGGEIEDFCLLFWVMFCGKSAVVSLACLTEVKKIPKTWSPMQWNNSMNEAQMPQYKQTALISLCVFLCSFYSGNDNIYTYRVIKCLCWG